MMQKRGWKWSQATVWAIEKGERPLRLAEAADLEDLLNLFPNSSPLLESPKRVTVGNEIRGLADAREELEAAIAAYDMARYDLAIKADALTEVDKRAHRDQVVEEIGVPASRVVADAHAKWADDPDQIWHEMVSGKTTAHTFRRIVQESARGEHQEA